MDNILDYFFSSFFYLAIYSVIFFTISSIVVFGTNFFRNKFINWTYKAIVVVFLLTPIFLHNHHGFSDEITEMCIIGNKLCFLDKKHKSDETSDWYEYRFHILNIDSGKKISRVFYDKITNIGHASGDSIFLYGNSNFVIIDTKSCQIIRRIDDKYLKERFSEFKSGIESIKFSELPTQFSINKTITVVNKKAKTYYYEPFSDKLLNDKILAPISAPNYSINDKNIFDRTLPSGNKIIISLENIDANSKLFILKFSDNTILKKNEHTKEEFINAAFINIIPEHKIFVFYSFETTDNKNILIHAYDFGGNKKWSLSQNDLKLMNDVGNEIGINTSVVHENNIIFSFRGNIISMNVLTGKKNWIQRV